MEKEQLVLEVFAVMGEGIDAGGGDIGAESAIAGGAGDGVGEELHTDGEDAEGVGGLHYIIYSLGQAWR